MMNTIANTNNTTNVATNNTAERIARAKYSAEYTALYTRLVIAGKCPWEYRTDCYMHPARFAEVSNVHVYNCAGLRSYNKFFFGVAAEGILNKFAIKAYESGMPVEDFFNGLRARLSRIVRTWDKWMVEDLENEQVFAMLEATAHRLEPEEANRLLKVTELLHRDTLSEECQEEILSLLSI